MCIRVYRGEKQWKWIGIDSTRAKCIESLGISSFQLLVSLHKVFRQSVQPVFLVPRRFTPTDMSTPPAKTSPSPTTYKFHSFTSILSRVRWFNLAVLSLTPAFALYGICTRKLTRPTLIFSILYYFFTLLGQSSNLSFNPTLTTIRYYCR